MHLFNYSFFLFVSGDLRVGVAGAQWLSLPISRSDQSWSIPSYICSICQCSREDEAAEGKSEGNPERKTRTQTRQPRKQTENLNSGPSSIGRHLWPDYRICLLQQSTSFTIKQLAVPLHPLYFSLFPMFTSFARCGYFKFGLLQLPWYQKVPLCIYNAHYEWLPTCISLCSLKCSHWHSHGVCSTDKY